ncbi:permease prefix domain 1-containing protein [Agromyces sp. LHK192]|uniref:permease prefix domain 1-containing protein n=1 Tax=Agromyces sp. LHK192 TaxID=2498704 RepID=UPI000FDB7FF9|nr:permease prefix domain 1-containing protein [Agromyces sp. LHK192]
MRAADTAGTPEAPGPGASPGLDDLVASWRSWVERRETLTASDIDELEGHLLDRVDALRAAGLHDDEAFLVAVKRLGAVDDLSHEYARVHSERLWKQLVLDDSAVADERRGGASGAASGVDADSGLGAASDAGFAGASDGAAAASRSVPFWNRANGLAVALLLGVGAGLAVKVAAELTTDPAFFLRNGAVLVLPFLAAWFAWRHRPTLGVLLGIAGAFLAAGLVLNLYPWGGPGATELFGAPPAATELLASLHAAVALWLVTGLAYVGDGWRTSAGRMDFVRFSGEWVVYYVLIALVGAGLSALTIGVFSTIDVDVAWFFNDWVLPCAIPGAVLVAAWLVDAKQRVIENIAPVLTKVFTPLFTIMLLALVVAAVLQWNVVEAERELLIAFDLVLVVVLALLVYSYSSRDPLQRAGWFERIQLVMLAAALVVDLFVLVAMVGRTGEFGWSPNKTASLGLNVILLVNLAWSAWLQLGFLRGRVPFDRLERWQTGYLPVYLAWAAIVAVAFPVLFGFE